jgi:hypothetical protein
VKQYGQLPGHSNDGSFVGILSCPLGELQSPAPQVAVLSKGPENVVRALQCRRSVVNRQKSNYYCNYITSMVNIYSDMRVLYPAGVELGLRWRNVKDLEV